MSLVLYHDKRTQTLGNYLIKIYLNESSYAIFVCLKPKRLTDKITQLFFHLTNEFKFDKQYHILESK